MCLLSASYRAYRFYVGYDARCLFHSGASKPHKTSRVILSSGAYENSLCLWRLLVKEVSVSYHDQETPKP